VSIRPAEVRRYSWSTLPLDGGGSVRIGPGWATDSASGPDDGAAPAARAIVAARASLHFDLAREIPTDLSVRVRTSQNGQRLAVLWNGEVAAETQLTVDAPVHIDVPLPESTRPIDDYELAFELSGGPPDHPRATVESIRLRSWVEGKPTHFIPYKRLGKESQADVDEFPLPATLVYRLGRVPARSQLTVGVAATSIDDPGAQVPVRVTIVSRGERRDLWNTPLRNPAAHTHLRPDSIDGDGEVDKLRDGSFGTASTWYGVTGGKPLIFRWKESHSLTAFEITSATEAAGAPTRLRVELSENGLDFSAPIVIDRSDRRGTQWHLLEGEPIRALRLTIERTRDDTTPAIREVLFSAATDLGALASRLGQWKRLDLDIGEFADRQANLEIEIGAPQCANGGCAAHGFVAGLRVLPERPVGAKNLILISMDTVRADRTSLYGYDRDTTPFLKELAHRRGVTVFTNARSTSTWTPVSHLSMMTGLTPFHHRVNVNFQQVTSWRKGERSLRALSPHVPTIASMLRQRGFLTVALATAGFLPGGLGLQNGFDVYSTPEQHLPNRALDYSYELQSKAAETESWLETHRDQQFFLFLHSYVAHHPYRDTGLVGCDADPARQRWCERYRAILYPAENHMEHIQEKDLGRAGLLQRDFVSDAYDSGLRLMDEYVRTVFAALDRLGLSENTIVVMTSDHGEAFGEHLEPFFGAHGYGFYDEFLRVPLLVARPSTDDSRRVDLPVSSVDILPTIAAAFQLPIPADDGSSLWSLVTGEEHREDSEALSDRLIFYEGMLLENYEEHHFVAVSNGWHKLLANLYDLGDGYQALFDLKRDPGELHDISAVEPDVSKRLLQALDEHVVDAFSGMVVLELRTQTPATIRGIVAFDQPVNPFEIDIRSEADYVRSESESSVFTFQLEMDRERRFLGFETGAEDFSVFLRLSEIPDDCTLIAGPGQSASDPAFSLLDKRDLSMTAAQRRTATARRSGCTLAVYYLEHEAGDRRPRGGGQWEDMSEETRERTLEQLRALGYVK